MKVHMNHHYAHFIPEKRGRGNRLCHEGNVMDKNVTDDYMAVTCRKCLKIYDDAQEAAIMEAEALAS